MRDVSATWRQTIPYSHAIVTRVDSYRGGVLLASDIPIVGGAMKYDNTGTLRRRLTISVPARDGLTRWDPGNNAYAPLNAYGQRLRVHTGIVGPGGPELVDLGETLITSWARDEPNGTVEIEAVDLAQLVIDNLFPYPTTPHAGNTFYQEFQRLVTPLQAAPLDAGLVDRVMPATSTVYDDERDKTLNELVATWGARWYVGDDGKAHAGPLYPAVPTNAVPAFTLQDGTTGTVTQRGRQAQRGALVNLVVVEGKASTTGSGVAPIAVAGITDPASPIQDGGPYGRVVRKFQSDLVITLADAHAAADAQLARLSQLGRAEKVSCVPDASIELGDIGRTYTEDGDAWVGRVATIDLPLTIDDGPMLVGLSNQPGVNP